MTRPVSPQDGAELLGDECGYIFGDMDAEHYYDQINRQHKGSIIRHELEGGRTQIILRAEEDGPLMADVVRRYINKLIQKGDIQTCPVCQGKSCYAYVNYTGPNCVPPIEMIGAASGDEWQCGHCKNYLVKRTSVYNNYGHRDD